MKRVCSSGTLVLLTVLLAPCSEPNPTMPASTNTFESRFHSVLQHALREPQIDRRLQLLSDVGANLSLAEIPDALKAADSLKELRERMVLRQTALVRWGELSPADAFVHIAKLPESQWKANTLREAAARFA